MHKRKLNHKFNIISKYMGKWIFKFILVGRQNELYDAKITMDV